MRKGTVKHLRDINTHFLTAEECILAGQLQNQHPSPCKLSSNGKFGSKFSTVVVSGMFRPRLILPLSSENVSIVPGVCSTLSYDGALTRMQNSTHFCLIKHAYTVYITDAISTENDALFHSTCRHKLRLKHIPFVSFCRKYGQPSGLWWLSGTVLSSSFIRQSIGAVASWLARSTPERAILVPRQDTLLAQCLSPPWCINGYRWILSWGNPVMD